VIARLDTLAQGTPAELALQALARAGILAAASRIGKPPANPRTGAWRSSDGLLRQGEAVVLSDRHGPADAEALLATRPRWDALAPRYSGQLRTYHAANPLRPGMRARS